MNKETIQFMRAVMDDQISHLRAERLKLIELRQAQAGPDQFHGHAVNAIESVISATQSTRASLPK